MTLSLRLDSIHKIDATSAMILQVIALRLVDQTAAYVNYTVIAKSLNIERETVRRSVQRMLKDRVLKKEDGKLSIPGLIISP